MPGSSSSTVRAAGRLAAVEPRRADAEREQGGGDEGVVGAAEHAPGARVVQHWDEVVLREPGHGEKVEQGHRDEGHGGGQDDQGEAFAARTGIGLGLRRTWSGSSRWRIRR